MQLIDYHRIEIEKSVQKALHKTRTAYQGFVKTYTKICQEDGEKTANSLLRKLISKTFKDEIYKLYDNKNN
tara:strand:- start:192 stop:404 length:213 start_codon:yes stop_codon:yes gene_type:complete